MVIFFSRAKDFVISPAKAFEAEKKTSFGKALKYGFIGLLIQAFLAALVASLLSSAFPALFGAQDAMFSDLTLGLLFLALFLTALILGFVSLLIWGAWLHIWAYMVGAKQGIRNTVKTVFYGATPTYLLGWIPFINIIFVIWSLVLTGLGLTKLQNLSRGVAAATILLGILVPLAILGVIMMFVMLALLSSLGPIAGTEFGTLPY